MSLHTPSLADYTALIERGDWRGVGELMLASADKLARVGAELLICPDNTIHQAFTYVEPRSPLPWLHIAAVTAGEAARRGFRRVGLTGTRWLVDSEVYPERLTALGLESVRPDAADREEISRLIMTSWCTACSARKRSITFVGSSSGCATAAATPSFSAVPKYR